MAEGPRLADLLPERLDRLGEVARTAMCKDSSVNGMHLAWDYVGRRLGDALRSALDCDLIDALSGGWAKCKAVLDQGDPQRGVPGEVATVELGEHSLTHECNPIVAITIGPCPCVELEFSFAVTAHFHALALEIADGHLLGGRPGAASASAQLSLQGVALHEPMAGRPLALPGHFRFAGPGIPIPRLAIG